MSAPCGAIAPVASATSTWRSKVGKTPAADPVVGSSRMLELPKVGGRFSVASGGGGLTHR